jgi:hypothetical protein
VCGTEYEYEGDTEQEDYDEDYYADMAREERLMDY